jgi:hypothetical protein
MKPPHWKTLQLLRQPHIQQSPAFALQQLLHRTGSSDLALVDIGLVGFLDVRSPGQTGVRRETGKE